GPVQHHIIQFKLTDDIGGLSAGDDVRIGGAKVGVVRGVDIVPGDGKDPATSHIDISISMPEDFVIRQDPQIVVQSTLTGLSVVNFADLGHGEAIAPDAVIHGGASGLTSFLASAAKIGIELTDTTIPRINHLVEHVDNKIDPIADKGTSLFDSLNSLLADTHGDIRDTLKSLNAVAAKVRERVPALLDRAQSVLDQVHLAVGRTNDALVDLQATAAHTRDVTSSARDILIGNRGKIDAMIASLRTTSENLKGASAEIRRSPWRLLYHPSPGEMANLNLYDTARQFADGANNLSDAATALRDEVKAEPSDQQKVNELLKKLEDAFAHFSDVEQQLWTRVKE
ncbi:MAG: hypothetical protein JO353_00830, partial [Phycisphaerae bacterium]|nr:hypothetical protein [Phycisphaerae bacterium]